MLQQSFKTAALSVPQEGGKSVLIVKAALRENNPNFVKNLPIIYSNFIVIMVTASW
jgi:hypothetical protein